MYIPRSSIASPLDIYPVGSIYISNSNTNPGTLFGGTWSSLGTGRTLVGVDTGDSDFNTVEKTGGAKTQTPSPHSGTAVADHPAHTHSVTSNVAVGDHADHTHGVTSNVSVSDHASHTHSVTSNVSVSDHASHTHSVTSNVAVADHAAHTHSLSLVTTRFGSGTTAYAPSSLGGTSLAVGTTSVNTGNPSATQTHTVTNNAVTSAGPSAVLSHTVTNNAVTSAGPSATLSHTVTNNAVTSSGASATLSHSVTNNAVTSGNPSATLSHSVTQPNDHAAMSVVQPYITVYMWKRTA